MSAETGFDVALVVWGTRGVEQMTVEQLRALGQARDVVVDPGAPPSIFELLRAHPAEVHDLRALYRDGEQRRGWWPPPAGPRPSYPAAHSSACTGGPPAAA